MSWKSGSLNLLEPSGPHRACYGTPLPFTTYLHRLLCFSAKHGFLRCVYAASRYKCRKEEALFLKKIAETLSDTRVYAPHCKNVNTQLCSHGSTQRAATSFIVMTMLTATYFSLHKRISLCCWEVIIACICANSS